MHATFKNDIDGNLWFMWCQEAEVRSRQEVGA